MNIVTVLFIFLAYGLFATLYNADDVGEAPEFPTLATPPIEFQEIPSSCDGFTDCIEFVGNIIVNIVLGFIFLVLLIAALLIFLVELFVLLSTNAVQGVDGAPDWFNILVVSVFSITVGVILYRAIRKGDTAA